MSPDEILVMAVASIICVAAVFNHLFTSRHRIMIRRSTSEGMVRLAFVLSLLWLVYVLYNHADPAVVGIYRLFYVVLGLAVVQTFGLGGSRSTGMRRGVDVLERDNPAAGLLIASFVLATGLIFGGSVWGEADPYGEGEGGWWIPMGFFLAGWLGLFVASWLYRVRETGGEVRRMRQTRDPRETLGFSLYLLSSGWILTESVSGDFYGWKQGLAPLAAIVGMLVVHDLIGLVGNRDQGVRPVAMTWIEVAVYIAISIAFSIVDRVLLPKWGILL